MREYSTREVADITGLTEDQIRRWAQAGLLSPSKDTRGHWRFSFQDLALSRTAAKLLSAPLTPNRVTRALRLIRDQLPEGRPLSAVRIVVSGSRVVVRDQLASWEPGSGQGTLDFDVRELSAPLAPPSPHRTRAELERENDNAASLYQEALDLELAGRGAEACAAYEAALARDPKLVSARINLGRLLHAAKRLQEAESLYRAALELEPHNALAAFNLGVVLEDRGDTDSAAAAYRQTLAIDDRNADAHYNLARLLEAKGDAQGALRHLSSFRRLTRNSGDS